MKLSKFMLILPLTALMSMGLIVPLAVEAAPRKELAVNLDGGTTLPPIIPEVDIQNKLEEQVPLDVTFTNAQGETVRLGDILDGDRPVVLQCGYFNCPALCGFVMNGMLDAMKASSLKVGEDYDVISLSISHEEGPELTKLKKQNYIAALGDPEAYSGWHFLTGSEANIRKVTNAVGFGFKYIAHKDEYAHPAALILLTPDGKVARYLFGVKYDPFTYEQSLIDASNGEIGSVWNYFIMTCFIYDETAGQYNWAAMGLMRMAGAVTVLIMVLVIGILLLRGSIVQRRVATVT